MKDNLKIKRGLAISGLYRFLLLSYLFVYDHYTSKIIKDALQRISSHDFKREGETRLVF